MANSLMVNALVNDGSGNLGEKINQSAGVTVTRYFVLANSALKQEDTEANAKITHRTSGTLSNLYARLSANAVTGSATTTIRTRKNSADGNQSVTFAAAVTGEAEDTSNTDVVTGSAEDEWNYSVAVAAPGKTPGSITLSALTSLFGADSNTVCRHAAVGFPSLADGATSYYAIAGLEDVENTEEAYSQFDTNAAANYGNLYVYFSSGWLDVVTLRKNGAATSVTVSPSGSGVWEDTGVAAIFAANDDICYEATAEVAACTTKIISIESTSTDQTFHSVKGRSTGVALSAGLTTYSPIGGNTRTYSTESISGVDMNIAAVVSNVTMYSSSNTIA